MNILLEPAPPKQVGNPMTKTPLLLLKSSNLPIHPARKPVLPSRLLLRKAGKKAIRPSKELAGKV